MNSILQNMRYFLTEPEKDQLHTELVSYFGLAGGLPEGDCKALESAWSDSNYQKAIKKYIKDWVEAAKRRKTTTKEVAMAYA